MWNQKRIAIAVVHGMGNQNLNFSNKFEQMIRRDFYRKLKKKGIIPKEDPLIIEPVYWAPIVQQFQQRLWQQIDQNKLGLNFLRKFVIHYLGDTIAYQPPNKNTILKEIIYEDIHHEFKKTLRNLAILAGKDAPLCIISHSLGTIISTNFVHDLQEKSKYDQTFNTESPLENGKTLAWFYTMGSPLALWSFPYINFGDPIKVPSNKLNLYHPKINGEWLNFYNNKDVLSYPLKQLNTKYDKQVNADISIKAGNLFTRFTPLCHSGYWNSKKVVGHITDTLVHNWLNLD